MGTLSDFRVRSGEVLREEHDLTDVIRRVGRETVEGLDDEEGLVANHDGALEVLRRERLDRRQRNRCHRTLKCGH